MAVKLRLARAGAKKAPYYRVVVTDTRSPRDGRHIEQIGIYDPTRTPVEVRLDHARIEYWMKNGATASDTVAEIIKRDKAKDKPGKGKKAA